MATRKIFILLMYLFVSVLFINYLYSSHQDKTILPNISFIDNKGEYIDLYKMIGNYIFIQFINSKDENDILLMNVILSKWNQENIIFIIFTDNYIRLREKMSVIGSNILVSDVDYDKMKKVFNVQNCCGNYYLYDEKANLTIVGRNKDGYENGVKIHLNNIIKHKKYIIGEFINENEYCGKYEWLGQINNVIKKGKYDYYVIALLSSVCDTCNSGLIVNKQNELYSKYSHNTYLEIILSDNFTDNDIKNLTSQYSIKMPILVADKKLNDKWKNIEREYGPAAITNYVLFINSEGKIMKIAYPGCNCYERVYEYIQLNIGKK